MASISKRPDGTWRARYRDQAGREHARHFRTKSAGQRWLDGETAKAVTGTWTDPKTAKTTVAEWCETWLAGYATRRRKTVALAKVHVNRIKKRFGDLPLSGVRPSAVRSWCAEMKAEGLSDSYVYACHSRLSQILGDAVHDNLIPRNPCSRRTSPGKGKQRPYVATTKQVWQIHDAFPEHLRPAVLLGAFAGLRTAEACGLRTADVDFMRGIIAPAVQYPSEPLKTETSRTPIPIPSELALELASYVERHGSEWIVTNGIGRQAHPKSIERAVQSARVKVKGLPEDFRFHDLRHHFASLLIAGGSDVKVVQTRLRHASAVTTLDVYGHMFKDADESTRATVAAALADYLRTTEVSDGL